ncbi:putative monooxygenase [Thozetella sp. PMI_491]|nr:putative monooxygenase [Thozetella sp. PMI_491]
MASGSYPHVLIIGGGLGGLALAQILRKQAISFEVFERDADETVRPQGWAIGLHTVMEDLVAAFSDDMPPLSEVDHFLPLKLPAQIMFYNTDHLNRRMGVTADGSGNIIRANRPRLRDWLRANIPVRYGRRAVAVSEEGDKVTLHFADGTSATGDILVGADGTHSIVRDHILAKRGIVSEPNVLPIGSIVGELTLSGQDFASQLALGHSAYTIAAARERCKAMFVGLDKVSPDGKTGYYYWMTIVSDPAAVDAEAYWTRSASQEEILEHAKELTSFIPPGDFRTVIDKTPPEGVRKTQMSFYNLDLHHGDYPAGRVVLLGDSAHPMTPFRGEGGVCAFMDALDLGRAIGQISQTKATGASLEKVMERYIDVMLTRGIEWVQLSRDAMNLEQRPGEDPPPRVTWGRLAVPTPRTRIAI